MSTLDERVAEFVGALVVPSNRSLTLRSDWKMRGAILSAQAGGFQVAKDILWTLNGVNVASTPDLSVNLPSGIHSFSFSYKDFLGRTYLFRGIARSYPPAEYRNRMAAASAAQTALW